MDQVPEQSAKIQFVEANRGRITSILEAGKELAAFVKPKHSVKLGEDKKLYISGVDREETPGDSDTLSIDEHLEVAKASSEMAVSLTLGKIMQLRGKTEVELRSKPEPSLEEYEHSKYDEVQVNTHKFRDDEGVVYEVRWSNVVAEGDFDEALHIQKVSVEVTDQLVSDKVTIKQVNDELTIDRDVTPVADELIGRLVEARQQESVDSEFFSAAQLAAAGVSTAMETMRGIAERSGNDTVGQLASAIVERGEQVQFGRQFGDNSHLPTTKQMSDTLELIGRMKRGELHPN